MQTEPNPRGDDGGGGCSGFSGFSGPLRINSHFQQTTTYSSKNIGGLPAQGCGQASHINTDPQKPDKPNKPPHAETPEVNSVSAVNSVHDSASKLGWRVVVAVMSGDPAKIAAAVAVDPELVERAAIKEFDGGMTRADAEVSTLMDVLDEVGYVI
jgi:hypothetical protein